MAAFTIVRFETLSPGSRWDRRWDTCGISPAMEPMLITRAGSFGTADALSNGAKSRDSRNGVVTLSRNSLSNAEHARMEEWEALTREQQGATTNCDVSTYRRQGTSRRARPRRHQSCSPICADCPRRQTHPLPRQPRPPMWTSLEVLRCTCPGLQSTRGRRRQSTVSGQRHGWPWVHSSRSMSKPCFVNRSAASLHALASLDVMYTLTPCWTKVDAIISPIPRPPPVTTAVLPAMLKREFMSAGRR